MATQTQYYNIDKPSYDEVADIEIINANMDKIDTQMRNNADGVNFAKGISSDAYDNSKPYAVGDYCIYDNKLYRCITAIESAEAFNNAKWEQTTVGNEVKQLNSNLDTIGKCKNLLNPTLQTNTSNGITCTNNGDGTYTLNGTKTTDTIWLRLGTVSLKANKSYKLIGQSPTNINVMVYDNDGTYFGNGTYGGATPIITPTTDLTLSMQISIAEPTLDNFTIKPMLTTNLDATYDDFVPYTGDGETITHDVAEIKNDLFGLNTNCLSLDNIVIAKGNTYEIPMEIKNYTNYLLSVATQNASSFAYVGLVCGGQTSSQFKVFNIAKIGLDVTINQNGKISIENKNTQYGCTSYITVRKL